MDQKQVQKREKPTQTAGLRAAPTYPANPFIKESVVEVRGKKRFHTVMSAGEYIQNPKTGEISGTVEHKVVHMVDDAQFVKIFANGVAGIYDLKSAGRKVFSYLLETVQKYPNTDRIYLHFMEASQEPWKISTAVFFRGLGELIEKQFVARSELPNMFFLNPLMVWNGDRFRFIQEYRKSTQKQVKQSEVIDDFASALGLDEPTRSEEKTENNNNQGELSL